MWLHDGFLEQGGMWRQYQTRNWYVVRERLGTTGVMDKSLTDSWIEAFAYHAFASE